MSNPSNNQSLNQSVNQSSPPELPKTFAYHQAQHFVPPPGQYGQVPVLHGPPGLDNQLINQSMHHSNQSINQPINQSNRNVKRSRSRSPTRHDPYTYQPNLVNQSNPSNPTLTPSYPYPSLAQQNAVTTKHKEMQRLEYAKQIKAFWAKQKELIDKTDYKKLKHDLPLARIKKIMKSDDEVRMISAEVPILFSKACELFILDLTMRAWSHTSDTNRRTLQRSDVADAIMEGEGMDFLVDIVPREDDSSIPVTASSHPMAARHHDIEQEVDGQSSFTTDSLLRRMEKEISGQRAMAAVPSAFPASQQQIMSTLHLQQMANMAHTHPHMR